MDQYYFEAQWPRDGLYLTCYVHEVMNFRFHWHAEDYELNILLHGRQHYCRGKESFVLEDGDVILVEPNTGHASYAQAQGTVALVLRFSSKALRQLAPKGQLLSFPNCRSSESDRHTPSYQAIRALAAQLIQALAQGGPYGQYAAKASMEMIISVLCMHFAPRAVSAVPEVGEEIQRTVRTIISYVEGHFREKVTLEQIAELTQYNRTYISTLFHKAVGFSFYEYLTRVRLQHALNDLATTEKGLTEVAFTNGFADLKTFNTRFRELLQCLPSEYRRNVQQAVPVLATIHDGLKYLPKDTPLIDDWIAEYLGKESASQDQ